jgi:nucleotide-binding universal stress UspA family protein
VQKDEFDLGDGPSVIVVGVDDSDTARRAAWYTVGLARRQGSRVVAVYVAPIPVTAAGPGGAAVVVAERQANEEIAAEVRSRSEEIGREFGVTITFVAAGGDPYHELTRIAT